MKKRLTSEETLEAFGDMVEKGTRVWGPRIQTAKRWFFRIIAGFFVLFGLLFLLAGEYRGALIMIAIGCAFALTGYLVSAKGGPGTYAAQKLVVSGIFALVGIGGVWLGYYFHQQGSASRDWPAASGTVLESKVEKTKSTTGKGSNRRTEIKYTPRVQYTYRVDGRSYHASRITYGTPRNSASQTVALYAKGKAIKVYYNPEKPDQSVLEPGADSMLTIVFTVIGAVLFFTGLLSGRKAFRNRRVLAQASPR